MATKKIRKTIDEFTPYELEAAEKYTRLTIMENKKKVKRNVVLVLGADRKRMNVRIGE
ncbi:hypothetical protein ACFLWB_01845 [Chloroflexota bacterium]